MGSRNKCLHVLAPLILEDGGVAPFNDVTLGFYQIKSHLNSLNTFNDLQEESNSKFEDF